MPVTAKLSKRFYEVLGKDVTNELVDWPNTVDATYRGDLRELNELNFARFDAKLEQRMAQMDAKIDMRIAGLKAELRQEIADLRIEMKEGFARADAKIEFVAATLQSSIQQSKAELLKWMFGTIFAAVVTLSGAMFALTKL